MTDTRRQAAEEWASHEVGSPLVQEHGVFDWRPTEAWLLAVKAHVSGDENGEQRAVEGIVRRLRKLDSEGLWPAYLGEQFLRAIERGEWKEGS